MADYTSWRDKGAVLALLSGTDCVGVPDSFSVANVSRKLLSMFNALVRDKRAATVAARRDIVLALLATTAVRSLKTLPTSLIDLCVDEFDALARIIADMPIRRSGHFAIGKIDKKRMWFFEKWVKNTAFVVPFRYDLEEDDVSDLIPLLVRALDAGRLIARDWSDFFTNSVFTHLDDRRALELAHTFYVGMPGFGKDFYNLSHYPCRATHFATPRHVLVENWKRIQWAHVAELVLALGPLLLIYGMHDSTMCEIVNWLIACDEQRDMVDVGSPSYVQARNYPPGAFKNRALSCVDVPRQGVINIIDNVRRALLAAQSRSRAQSATATTAIVAPHSTQQRAPVASSKVAASDDDVDDKKTRQRRYRKRKQPCNDDDDNDADDDG